MCTKIRHVRVIRENGTEVAGELMAELNLCSEILESYWSVFGDSRILLVSVRKFSNLIGQFSEILAPLLVIVWPIDITCHENYTTPPDFMQRQSYSYSYYGVQ